jgi:hypothetical protein
MDDFLQRYSQIEFPTYRFIPGENPHPTENPLGHSYGKKESDVKIFVPDNWSNNEQYLFGIDLYNYGYWWESHEAWESLWQVAPRDHVSRDFLQGLIKVSGAFLKWHSKNKNGLEYLYTGAMKQLLKVGEEHPVYMGLNIVDHIQKLENHFKPILEKCNWPDPLINYPYIILMLQEGREDLMEDLKYSSRAEYEGFGSISNGRRGAT